MHLSEGDDSLLRSHATSLDHNEIVVHFTVMGESTHWCDRFFRKIVFSGCVVLDNLTVLGMNA